MCEARPSWSSHSSSVTRVYDILGYLEEPVRSSSLQIDVDAFDRDAIHIVARTKHDKNVAGCARLNPSLASGQSRCWKKVFIVPSV